MNFNFKPIAIGALLIMYTIGSYAQTDSETLPLTADSLSTGNYKDVFKSFFQLAFDKITSKDKSIQFTSNPFAVMTKMDTSLLIDNKYYKYRHIRDLNFAFAAKLDSSYKFNGFSSGIKYALVNDRDETISREFVKSAFEANDENNKLNNDVNAYLTTLDIGDPHRQLYRQQANDFFSGKINFSDVDPDFQEIIKTKAKDLNLVNFLIFLEKDKNFNVGSAKKLAYDSLKTLFQKGWLWTVGVSDTTYKDQFAFSNVVLSTQVLKGISKPFKSVGVEIDFNGAINFLDDTLKIGRDLKRTVLLIEPGLNLSFKIKRTQYSWAEFKLSGGYTNVLSGRYLEEMKDNITLNATLRIRIINDIWIPFEIKYDPKSGNVFGFLNVRANFTGIGKLLKGSGT